jgi:hypothetical protein
MEDNLSNTKNISNIEVINWAFEKGYRLASADMKDGIHINFTEIGKYFLHKLGEFHTQQNNKMYSHTN